jgi:D-hydroxyproline dehydrogenase subunit beta
MQTRYDDAIVGAGIIGLAHAYTLAKRGRRVIVFERHAHAQGASVRNFGTLWPIGQPAGPRYQLARRSLEIWREVLAESGLWHSAAGSLHLAYHEDEVAVLHEFLESAPQHGYECEWLDAAQAALRSAAINPHNLRGALWSPTEVCVDPREILAQLPGWLHQTYGVWFEFDCAVMAYQRPQVLAGGREWRADNLYVCAGEDLQALYPAEFAASGLYRCKLQMMRSQAYGAAFRVGPLLAAGLTLGYYKAFERCPSLPALQARFARELIEHVRYGIHVLVAQHAGGEITLGDSHEYGEAISPFDKAEIDRLILEYLHTFFRPPALQIVERWHGVYLNHPSGDCWIARPHAGATLVGSPGGKGMTVSFGVAEQVVRENLGEA